MNIYFSCSITGGRNDQLVYRAIVDLLLAQGHDVPTAHLAESDVMAVEDISLPRDIYLRDVQWVRECDALIAEVTTPSHGVGYEIALALEWNKPVLCCYQAGRRVSKMITGNTSPTLQVVAYENLPAVTGAVQNFLKNLRE